MNEIPSTEAIRSKLGSDLRWALRGLEVMYLSDIPFSPVDAEILTSLARQLARKGGTKAGVSLSRAQCYVLLREMPKYAKRLREVALAEGENND